MDVRAVCESVKRASNEFLSVNTDMKNKLLLQIKKNILDDVENLKKINSSDVEQGKANGLSAAFCDRLTLNDARIKTICDGIDDVVALPDYVGTTVDKYVLKNGLCVQRVRAPLGVVGIIYEARPNVTVDAAALCIKSGNGVVLKGGKEAINTNRKLVELMRAAFRECGVDPSIIGFIDSVDRQNTLDMLHEERFIDVVIPRGGEKLKKFVLKEAAMPVIASSGGNCHIYVEKTANFDMAVKVILNAKVSRPSVCNAAETLLVDRCIAAEFLPMCLKALEECGVEIRGTEEATQIYPSVKVVEQSEFFVEYNDLIIKVKLVSSTEEAIEHINSYGTHHSEAIITQNVEKAKLFTKSVDSGCVYVNASTRFTDGFELGLGAEMGISTQKLHVRGPIGLKELTSVKYVIEGNGQIRC